MLILYGLRRRQIVMLVGIDPNARIITARPAGTARSFYCRPALYRFTKETLK
jgi:hypothetical protein